MSPRFARYAWLVLAFTLGVILWGAFVRASGAGAGCGSHWPLCNGEVIPQPKSVKTVIELTHRVTSALSGLLVLVQVVWAMRALPRGHLARKASGFAMFFMLTEGAVGAALVKLEMVAENKSIGRAYWMSLHLVNTFLLLASMGVAAWAASRDVRLELRKRPAVAAIGTAALAGALVLGTSGAVTALGDTLFPSTSLAEGLAQDLSATAHFLLRLRVLHPVIGLAVLGYVLFAATRLGAEAPDVRRHAIAASALFVGQVGLGFLNLALLAPISLQILHLLVADLVWLALVLLVAASVSTPRPAA